MAKVGVRMDYEYIAGHLRYGHRQGELEIPDDKIDKFLENPKEYIEENDLEGNLKLFIDDYEINDWGGINNVRIYPIGGE